MGGSARSDVDRLPWLDPPRPAKPILAARRARTPLLVLLGLFVFSAIAVMAYLAGRSTTPVATTAPEVSARAASPAAPAPAPTPVPTPVPAAPIAPPAPVVMAPAPVALTPAPPVAAPIRAAPAKPRATRPRAKRKATIRRSSSGRQVRRPDRAVVAHRNTDRARAQPSAYATPQRRTVWPVRPFAGPRGRVIQLGAYVTPAQADAAWWRVARSYPYLTSLPRMVTWIGPSRGRPRTYRVRLAAGSNREARALCSNLHRIGRGCIVV